MLPVVLSVHPLTRKVLIARYGDENIFLKNHDPLFDIVSGCRRRPAKMVESEAMSAAVVFHVSEKDAIRIRNNGYDIARRLFRQHINEMRWYAAAHIRALGQGHGTAAILDWLYLHGVDEDDFSSEAAYKSFQRFGWNLDEKNSNFSGQIRRKMSAQLSRKMRNRAKGIQPVDGLKIKLKDAMVEMAVSRFLASYSNAFRRVPAKLPRYAKVYMYVTMQSLSLREAEKKLRMNRTSIGYAMSSIRKSCDRNPTIKVLLEQSIDLPQPV